MCPLVLVLYQYVNISLPIVVGLLQQHLLIHTWSFFLAIWYYAISNPTVHKLEPKVSLMPSVSS